MYRFLSNLYPKNVKVSYKNLLMYSAIKINTERFIGFVLFFGFGLSLAFSLMFANLINTNIFFLFAILFIVVEVLVYMLLLLKADAKARFVESILPEVLQLMSSNLRAGLTTDKALLLSARPEFGPFQDEINYVGKEITIGADIGKALVDMSKRIKSERLQKTMLLIVSGLRSGGQLAALLEQTAKNLRQQRFVDERIRANVMMYVIFIFAAIGFGAPLLFGLSSFLVEVLTKNLASIDIPQTALAASMPMMFTEVTISADFVIKFAVVSLVMNSILGSFVLGLISKGKESRGLRYIPVLIALTMGVFFLVRFVIKNMLSGLFGV